jgi:hypothetical protein
MSVHAFVLSDSRRLGDVVLACHDIGHAPSAVTLEGTALTITFPTDLSAGDLALVTATVAAMSSAVSLTRAERDTIRPSVQALRDFRQLGRNAFMALTAAERDRQLYDAQTATTIVLLALLRE